MVVAVEEAAGALLVVGAAVDVEGDDDGGVPLGEVVARGGREARGREGPRVGDVVVPGGLAAEADEAAGGGERGGVLVDEGGEGGVRDELLGAVVVVPGRGWVEGSIADGPGKRVVEEARERRGRGGWAYSSSASSARRWAEAEATESVAESGVPQPEESARTRSSSSPLDGWLP